MEASVYFGLLPSISMEDSIYVLQSKPSFSFVRPLASIQIYGSFLPRLSASLDVRYAMNGFHGSSSFYRSNNTRAHLIAIRDLRPQIWCTGYGSVGIFVV